MKESSSKQPGEPTKSDDLEYPKEDKPAVLADLSGRAGRESIFG